MMAAATDDGPGREWAEVVGRPADAFMEIVEIPDQGPCVRLTMPEAANALFYHDCAPEDQAWAFEHLTPLPLAPSQEVFHLPRFWGAPIPRDFIVCTDDRSHSLAMDNVFMERLGLSRALGVVSSHSPFLSRPVDTAKLLDACARGALAWSPHA
jgi:hypothetical protein